MGGCGGCLDPKEANEALERLSRKQRFPGVDQQRKNVTPTGGAPGYRVRRVRELPPGGQNMDYVWSDADNSICVWVDDHWVCLGGGSAICADFLISPCWDEAVAAGLGVEGQQFTDPFGCTYRVVSTAQLSWDGHTGDATHAVFTGFKNFTTSGLGLICHGNVGGLTTPTDNGNNDDTITYQGTDKELSVIEFWDDDGSTTGGKHLRFVNLAIPGTGLERCIQKETGQRVYEFDNIVVGTALGMGPRIYEGTGNSYRVTFPTSAGGQYALDMFNNPNNSYLYDCIFSDAFRVGRQPHLINPTIYNGGRAIGIICEADAGATVLNVQSPTFDSGGSAFTNYVSMNKNFVTFNIQDVIGNASCSGPAVLMGALFNGGGRSTLSGSFRSTDPRVIQNLSANALAVDVKANMVGAIAANPEGASGAFNLSSFDFGHSKAYVTFTTIAGMTNIVSSPQLGRGAPTHIGNEGIHYVDLDTDTEYINCSALQGTCWSVIGSYGGVIPPVTTHMHPANMPIPIFDDWEMAESEPFMVRGPQGEVGATGATGPPGSGSGGGVAMPLAQEVDWDVLELDQRSPSAVYISKYFDAVVDASGGRSTAGVQIYSKIVDAIAAGHRSIFVRGTAGDTVDIVVASGDNVRRIIGQDGQTSLVPVNVTSNKADVLFESLQFFDGANAKFLRLNGARNVSFACVYLGNLVNRTALLNDGTGINSTDLSIAYDTGSSPDFIPTRGMAKIDNEVFGYSAGGGAASGTLTVSAGTPPRGSMDTLADSHADDAPIVSLHDAHLAINAADCQVVQNRFIACSNNNVHCIGVFRAGARARLISNVYLLNDTYSVIATFPEDSTSQEPKGMQVVGSTFDGNTTTDFLLTFFNRDDHNIRGDPDGIGVAGNFFSLFSAGAIMLHGRSWNISGNSFNGVSGNGSFLLNGAIIATDTTFNIDTIIGNHPRKGMILIDSEWIFYSVLTGTQAVSCIRGALGTTAAAHADNAGCQQQSQRLFYNKDTNISTNGALYHLITGNTVTGTGIVHISNGGNTNHCRVYYADNAITNPAAVYSEENAQWINNLISSSGSWTFDFRSKSAQSVFGGRLRGAAFANLASDTFLFVPSVQSVTGTPTTLVIPTNRIFALGRSAGDVVQIAMPLTNRTGANSVAAALVALDNANDNSFVNNPGAASARVIGVCVEAGIADGSPALVAIHGTVAVTCTTAGAVVAGDILEFSATAGQAQTSVAPPTDGIVFGKAMTAKAAAAAGSVKCVLTH